MATFKVNWTKFTVVKKHDIDRDKPYLWVFGIVVDAQAIADGKYVIRKRCDSGNLGKKFKKGARRHASRPSGPPGQAQGAEHHFHGAPLTRCRSVGRSCRGRRQPAVRGPKAPVGGRPGPA